MNVAGECCLLVAFVTSGFAAVACLLGWHRGQRALWTAGVTSAISSVAAVSAVTCILAWALVTKDFHFDYVVRYSSVLLPWHYALSALWVGQAGSLLLWAWLLGMLALPFGLWSHTTSHVAASLRDAVRVPASNLRPLAFGILMAYLCFLLAIMVFAADPMEVSLSKPRDGAGLSPLLQHPAMLIHPPIIFLGYALWTMPFALACVALASGQLDAQWIRQARPWALAGWVVLGVGILWGADWAYEELGWGGYWGWDPVENGSLIPWLTGTALIHTMMAWQYRGVFKRTSIVLAVATFGLCNFATFLTRSGIFSSLHAFSASPIGWLFLGLMFLLAAGAVILLIRHRTELRPDTSIQSVLSREAFVLISVLALVLLTVVTIAGTLSTAISGLINEQPVMVGPGFYNSVLIPTGLVLLLTTTMAPLLRWGEPPTKQQVRWLSAALVIGAVAAGMVAALGWRHPLQACVVGLASAAAVALAGALAQDSRRREPGRTWLGLWSVLRSSRRQYAGFLIHLGFCSLAAGVVGSSLGRHEQDVEMQAGQSVEWAGYAIRFEQFHERQLPDKTIGEAELAVLEGGRQVATLWPAQHFHQLQKEWTTEVDIYSTWRTDVYVILRSADGEQRIRATLIENPGMRWLWMSGWIAAFGAVLRLWPDRRRRKHVLSIEDHEPRKAAA